MKKPKKKASVRTGKKTAKPAKKKNEVSRHPAAKKPAIPINSRDLQSIQKKLLAMRSEILTIVNNKKNYDLMEPEVGDGADQASQSLEKEMLFELSDNERTMLDLIESALRRIEKRTYGLCESCRHPIAKKRLNAIPAARYCIQCQSTSENAA